MAITTTEFARRLCVRNHPHLKTTGAVVPCGQHLNEGTRYWFLATPAGTHSFNVIRDAREEFLDDEGPVEGDTQRRCWTIKQEYGEQPAQCVLYHEHPGDEHLFAVPTAVPA